MLNSICDSQHAAIGAMVPPDTFLGAHCFLLRRKVPILASSLDQEALKKSPQGLMCKQLASPAGGWLLQNLPLFWDWPQPLQQSFHGSYGSIFVVVPTTCSQNFRSACTLHKDGDYGCLVPWQPAEDQRVGGHRRAAVIQKCTFLGIAIILAVV